MQRIRVVDTEMISTAVTCLGKTLRQKKWHLITAESCTGGGIVHAITSVPGSSEWCHGGFVTYSNVLKQHVLNVPPSILSSHGAVSKKVVMIMAEHALKISEAQCAIAVSGIAGPSGGTVEKPVGTVWIAWVCLDQIGAHRFLLQGNRQAIRQQSILFALQGMYDWCTVGKLSFKA